MLCQEEEELYSNHEEADSRMFFHLNYISGPSNVVTHTDDTDSLVIALGCKHLFDQRVNIWLEARVQSQNNMRYININEIYNQLEETLCKALPAYHALTGCDYSASYCRKGKIQPFQILEKDVQTQEVFGKLANMEELDETSEEVIEKYTCKVFGKKHIDKFNDVRSQIFLGKYEGKKSEEQLSCSKKYNSSMMTPCQKVLRQKIKRVHLTARRWVSSTRAHPPNDNPEDFDWILSEDGSYKVK